MSANENRPAGANGRAAENIENANNYTTSWPLVPEKITRRTGHAAAVNDLHAFGRQCRRWGAAVTAIRPRTKRPNHKWRQWQTQVQTDDEFERLPWSSAAAVGVVNGAGDWRVFDLDAEKDDGGRPVGPVPEAVVIELLKALGLPDDYQWSYVSGSGAGFGVVIRCPELLPTGWRAEKGVYIGHPKERRAFGQLELRWSRGQTIIAGAHPTGPGYRWRLGSEPFVPPALLSAERVVAGFIAIATMDPSGDPSPAGQLPAWPVKGTGYGAAALADAVGQVCRAANGSRNNTLFRQAAGLAELVNGGALDRQDVEQQLADAALAAGLPGGEIRATLASAFDHVGDRLRPPPSYGTAVLKSIATESAKNQGAASPIYTLSYRPEDGGLMDVWRELHGEEWLYVTGFEEWYQRTNTHWQVDPGGYALQAQIVALIDEMNQVARRLRNAASGSKTEFDRLTAYVNATKRTSARVSSVERLARLVRYTTPVNLDSADVLNFANGTLELSTLTLRPHDPVDLLTYCLPYDYDPSAVAPNWEIVMSRIDRETARFLQEYAGYAITPDTHHELAIWLYGPPGRGASTLLAGLQSMLGPKAMLLGLADIERNRFALSGLPGKTLAVATEQPADYMATTHVLNALISGEPVTVDRKYREAVTINPRAKLAWAMNELPRIKGASDGIFRRVKVVSFSAIPEHERRPDLKEAVKAEAAGILNWALEGLRRLRDRGRFEVPAGIEAATQAFAQQNDIPKVFVDDRCEIGPGLSIGSRQLYSAYANWCEETGHKAQSETNIANDWKRLGFEKVKTPAGMVWEGVSLGP